MELGARTAPPAPGAVPTDPGPQRASDTPPTCTAASPRASSLTSNTGGEGKELGSQQAPGAVCTVCRGADRWPYTLPTARWGRAREARRQGHLCPPVPKASVHWTPAGVPGAPLSLWYRQPVHLPVSLDRGSGEPRAKGLRPAAAPSDPPLKCLESSLPGIGKACFSAHHKPGLLLQSK